MPAVYECVCMHTCVYVYTLVVCGQHISKLPSQWLESIEDQGSLIVSSGKAAPHIDLQDSGELKSSLVGAPQLWPQLREPPSVPSPTPHVLRGTCKFILQGVRS